MGKPKPHLRTHDKSAFSRVRARDGVCLWGLRHHDGCTYPLEAHHIIPRSLGGPDADRNLILLCHRHHQMTEDQLIKPAELAQLLIDHYGYSYPQDEARIIWA